MTGGQAAALVIAGGMAAALHVGKLPPVLPVWKGEFGIDLVQSGFLLSMVQLAGMTLGLLVGLAADRLGLKRTMAAGLAILGACSLLGAQARAPGVLLLLRGGEGVGFLLASVPAPALIRRLVEVRALSRALGVWGAYMPAGTAIALLLGPAAMVQFGWPGWWSVLALLALGMAGAIAWALPASCNEPSAAGVAGTQGRLARTLTSRGAWLAGLAFGFYSAQWLAVIGFLPTLYAQAGIASGVSAIATALAAAVNAAGNIASGRLLHRGVSPAAVLWTGYAAMASGAAIAFGPWAGMAGAVEPPLRFAGVLLFSGVSGLVPGTLFTLAVRVAPDESTVSTTVGWMQQLSALGQFAGPPFVAAVVAVRGWESAWHVTATFAAAGALVTYFIARMLKTRDSVGLRPAS